MSQGEVSQLELDILTALAATRELKNSSIRINRIPSDILSLIPTHLDSQGDVLRASFVCRHWRRVFLQHGALWSKLFIQRREDYVTTLLERAKGSALHIALDDQVPPHIIALLCPHAQKIRHLEFVFNCWTDISRFSQVNSGQLPLLRTLEIWAVEDEIDVDDQSDTFTTPPLPLFSGCVNLEEFNLHLEAEHVRTLDHFVFPNLTMFSLTVELSHPYDALELLDFLKASPTLRTVNVKIYGRLTPEDVPQHMSVILPNVETFSLYAMDDEWHVFESAMHISCPRAKHTSLTHAVYNEQMTNGLNIFPDSASWKTIVRQYSTSPVEGVTLEINGGQQETTNKCSLTFRSFDATVIKLGFKVSETLPDGIGLSREEVNLRILTQACRVIRSHPLLSSLRRLHIKDYKRTLGTDHRLSIAYVIGGLFESLGPLDELIIHGCDVQIFLLPFINPGVFQSFGRILPRLDFPRVKELTISEALMVDEKECVDGIVNLAKLQHELQRPFEHVTIWAREIPTMMAERLGQWVGAVDCHEP